MARTLSTSLFWGHRPDLAALSAAIFSPAGRHRDVIIPWMRGLLTSEEVMRLIAREANVAYEVALGELIASCQGMILAATGVLDLVAALRAKGIKVVIATDNMDTFCRWTVPSLGLERHFDAVLCSAELKALKGDVDSDGRSLFFQQFLAREGIGPGESILLDDSAEAGARVQVFGIDFLQVTPDAGLVSALRSLSAQ